MGAKRLVPRIPPPPCGRSVVDIDDNTLGRRRSRLSATPLDSWGGPSPKKAWPPAGTQNGVLDEAFTGSGRGNCGGQAQATFCDRGSVRIETRGLRATEGGARHARRVEIAGRDITGLLEPGGGGPCGLRGYNFVRSNMTLRTCPMNFLNIPVSLGQPDGSAG